MNLVLKYVLLSLLLSGPQQLTCRNTRAPDKAILTGFDQRMCACCGGLMITFGTDPTPYRDTFYLIDNAPAALGITDSATFPIYVKVRWQKLSKCAGKYIRINRLIRQ